MDDVFHFKGARKRFAERQGEGGLPPCARQASAGRDCAPLEAETWTSIDQKPPVDDIVGLEGRVAMLVEGNKTDPPSRSFR